MKRILTPAACAVAILLSGASVDAILAPAAAQSDFQIGFDTFHDQLASYGDWVYSDRWGEVWIPSDVPDNFQPYGTNGYWADTDEYGWTWVSNYEWGDIPFHYGRWVNDPDDGWMWIPGYVWSPAWVIWRSNGQYVGWMPMPPDREFLEGGGPSIGVSFGHGTGFSIDFGNTGDYYGYSQWYGPSYDESRFASNWVFVGTGHLADRDFERYQAPRAQYATYIHNTKNITNYTVVNNYIVNKSVDPSAVQRAGGHPVAVVHVDQVIKKPQSITRADQGREVQQQMRRQMPRGTGTPDSAPKPSAQVVQSLSTKVAPHAGHPAAHLYTRDTVTSAPLPNKPANAPAAGMVPPKPAAPNGGAAPPSGEKPTEHARPSMTGPATQSNAPATGAPEALHRHATPATPNTAPASPETTRRHETEAPATAPTTPETMRRHETAPSPTAPSPTTPPVETMRRHETAPSPAAASPTTPPVETMRRHETAPAETPAAPAETPRHRGNAMDNQMNGPPPPPVEQRAVRPVAPVAPPVVQHVPEKPATPPPPPPDKKDKHDDGKPQ